MPYFSERVDCEMDISPSEFVEKCSNRELERLIDEIEGTSIFMKRYYDRSEEDPEPRNYSHLQFCQNLVTLKKAWYQVSREDAEIIAILSKKYE